MRETAAPTLRMLAGLAAAPVAAVLISVGAYDLFWVAGAGGAATFWLVSVCGTSDFAGRSSLPLGT